MDDFSVSDLINEIPQSLSLHSFYFYLKWKTHNLH